MLLLSLCVMAMRHRQALPTPWGLHLPDYSPGPCSSPLGLPTTCPQPRTLFNLPNVPTCPAPCMRSRAGQTAKPCPATPGLGPQGPFCTLKAWLYVSLETQEDFIFRCIKFTLVNVGNTRQHSDILLYLFPRSFLWKAEYVTQCCNKGLVLREKVIQRNVLQIAAMLRWMPLMRSQQSFNCRREWKQNPVPYDTLA